MPEVVLHAQKQSGAGCGLPANRAESRRAGRVLLREASRCPARRTYGGGFRDSQSSGNIQPGQICGQGHLSASVCTRTKPLNRTRNCAQKSGNIARNVGGTGTRRLKKAHLCTGGACNKDHCCTSHSSAIATYGGGPYHFVSGGRHYFGLTVVTTLLAFPAECGATITRSAAGDHATKELAPVRTNGGFS